MAMAKKKLGPTVPTEENVSTTGCANSFKLTTQLKPGSPINDLAISRSTAIWSGIWNLNVGSSKSPRFPAGVEFVCKP